MIVAKVAWALDPGNVVHLHAQVEISKEIISVCNYLTHQELYFEVY